MQNRVVIPENVDSFGDMLRFFRRRLQLTQRDLGIAVGYSEGHINRFEKNKHLPDLAAVKALFIPALQLDDDPDLAESLILSWKRQTEKKKIIQSTTNYSIEEIQSIPEKNDYEIIRSKWGASLLNAIETRRHVFLTGVDGIGKTKLAAQVAREISTSLPVFWLDFRIMEYSPRKFLEMLSIFVSHFDIPQFSRYFSTNENAPTVNNLPSYWLKCLNSKPCCIFLDHMDDVVGSSEFRQILQSIALNNQTSLVFIGRENVYFPDFYNFTLSGFDLSETVEYLSSISESRIDFQLAQKIHQLGGGNPSVFALILAEMGSGASDIGLLDSPAADKNFLDRLCCRLVNTLENNDKLVLQWFALMDEPVEQNAITSLGKTIFPMDASQLLQSIKSLQRLHLLKGGGTIDANPVIKEFLRRQLQNDPERTRVEILLAGWYQDYIHDPLAAAYHYYSGGSISHSLGTLDQGLDVIIRKGQTDQAIHLLSIISSDNLFLQSDSREWLIRIHLIKALLYFNKMAIQKSEQEFKAITWSGFESTYVIQTLFRGRRLAGIPSIQEKILDLLTFDQAAASGIDPISSLQKNLLECKVYASRQQWSQVKVSADTLINCIHEFHRLELPAVSAIFLETYQILAQSAYNAGQLDLALEYGQIILTSCDKLDTGSLYPETLIFLGKTLYQAGDLDGAENYFNNAISFSTENNDQITSARAMIHLARSQFIRLNLDEAIIHLEKGIKTLSILDSDPDLFDGIYYYCQLLVYQNRIDEAEHILESTVRHPFILANYQLYPKYQSLISIIQVKKGNIKSAEACLQSGMDYILRSNDNNGRFSIQTIYAYLFTLTGDHDRARQILTEKQEYYGISIWNCLDRKIVESIYQYRSVPDIHESQLSQLVDLCKIYPLYKSQALELIKSVS